MHTLSKLSQIETLERELGIPHMNNLPIDNFRKNHLVWTHPDFSWFPIAAWKHKKPFRLTTEISDVSHYLNVQLGNLHSDFFDKELCNLVRNYSELSGNAYFQAKENISNLVDGSNGLFRNYLAEVASGLSDLANRLYLFRKLSSNNLVNIGISSQDNLHFLKAFLRYGKKENASFFLTESDDQGFIKDIEKERFAQIQRTNPIVYLTGAYIGECVNMTLSDLYPIFNEVRLLHDFATIRPSDNHPHLYHISPKIKPILKKISKSNCLEEQVELLISNAPLFRDVEKDSSFYASTDYNYKKGYPKIREFAQRIKPFSKQQAIKAGLI